MEMPKVSVLMPTYNQAGLVEATLDSVLAQDYENFEVIVRDDASPDETVAVLRAYAGRHPGRVKVIAGEKNLGVTGNMNELLAVADGVMLCFTGGDDLFKPGRITAQVEALLAAPEAGLCHADMEWFESDTGRVLRRHHGAGADKARLESLDALVEANYVGGPSVMVRKSAVPAHGFDGKLPMVSDWIFAIECGLGGIVYVDEVLMGYRITSTSVSRNTGRMLDEAEQTLELVGGRYPQLLPAAKRGMARVRRAQAMYALELGMTGAARKLIKLARQDDPHNKTLLVAWCVWLVAALEKRVSGQTRLTKRLIARLRG